MAAFLTDIQNNHMGLTPDRVNESNYLGQTATHAVHLYDADFVPSPTVGYVLTATDLVGHMSWQNPSSSIFPATLFPVSPAIGDVLTATDLLGHATFQPPAPAPSLEFADFFALMPGDNAATVAVGGDLDFPQNGPTSASGITRTGVDTFQLAAIGTYKIEFQVSVTEPGQFVVTLQNVEIPSTRVGRATGTNQIYGTCLITTTVVNSIVTIRNPAGNAAALTITPTAGGAGAVSAHLVIQRLR